MNKIVSLPRTLLDQVATAYLEEFQDEDQDYTGLERGMRRRSALCEALEQCLGEEYPEPAKLYAISRIHDFFTQYNIWNPHVHPAAHVTRPYKGPFPDYIEPLPWRPKPNGTLRMDTEYTLGDQNYVPAWVEVVPLLLGQDRGREYLPQEPIVPMLPGGPGGVSPPLTSQELDSLRMAPPYREGSSYASLSSLSLSERNSIIDESQAARRGIPPNGPSRSGTSRSGPSRSGPSHSGHSHSGPSRSGSSHASLPYARSSQASSQTNLSQTASIPTESSATGSLRSGHSRAAESASGERRRQRKRQGGSP